MLRGLLYFISCLVCQLLPPIGRKWCNRLHTYVSRVHYCHPKGGHSKMSWHLDTCKVAMSGCNRIFFAPVLFVLRVQLLMSANGDIGVHDLNVWQTRESNTRSFRLPLMLLQTESIHKSVWGVFYWVPYLIITYRRKFLCFKTVSFHFYVMQTQAVVKIPLFFIPVFLALYVLHRE